MISYHLAQNKRLCQAYAQLLATFDLYCKSRGLSPSIAATVVLDARACVWYRATTPLHKVLKVSM